MIDKIYNRLSSPRTTEDFCELLEEIGVNWNMSQVRLLLELDSKIDNVDGKWQAKKDEKKDIILNTIERVLGNKPIVTIAKVLKALPGNFIISEGELLRAALESERYTSTNNKTLKRK